MLLPLLMPLLAHAKPLITPATPLPGTAPSATSESVIKPEPESSATQREPGMVRKAEPTPSLKPVTPKAPGKSSAMAPSAATPGLYLSGVDDPADLLSGYRFRGLLPPNAAATVVSKAGAKPSRAPASRSAQRDVPVSLASAPGGRARGAAVAKVSASRASAQKAASSEGLQSGDACSRMDGGTLVIRTGQGDSPCSGAEFRTQVSRQLKAAMADIDASAPGTGSAGVVSTTSQRFPSWHHITITSPPPHRSVIARAPGEDNLRRLNSRSSWADQYQSRMAEIRTGQ